MTIKAPFWHPSLMSGFLLDWDGVLAETKLDFSEIRSRYYGGRGAMLLEDADILAEGERDSMLKDLYEMEINGAERAVPVRGASELLGWLDSNGIPYAIVSRNCMDSIKLAAKKIGLALPERVFGRDNARRLKPDPRALAEAAASIGRKPGDCVFVGDFLYDLQGARRAGMRAVLVQRPEHDWHSWSDVEYPTLSAFVEALKNPEPLVPWEYSEIMAKKGEKWLSRVYCMTLTLPEQTSPTLDCWLLRAAAMGVGRISVPSEAVLTPEDWKHNPSFPISAMGIPLSEAAKDLLSSRFPLTSVVTDAEDGIKAPKNSLDLQRFIERKIY